MNEINKTTKMIERLEDQIRKCKRENVILSSVIDNTKGKKHHYQLVEAGQIFEDLGILEQYDKAKVTQLLKDNLELIVIKNED